ncbi:MAG: glycosyltransferase [bacterium]
MGESDKRLGFGDVESKLLEEYHELFASHGVPLWFVQSGDEADGLTPGTPKSGGAERILVVSTHGYWADPPPAGVPDTGGQTHYVLEIAKAWARSGRSVIILARWFEPFARVEKFAENCWLIRLRAGPDHFVRKEDLYPLAAALAEGAAAVGLLFGAQAVTGHYADGMVVAAEVAERLELPLVCVPHSLGILKMIRLGMDPHDQQELRDPRFHFWTRESFELSALRAANFAIATTPKEPRSIEEHYGIRFPFDVMSEGASQAFFDAAQQEPDREALARLGLTEGRFLMFWGRLSKAKYAEGLVRAFAELRRQDPAATRDLRLVIVGTSLVDPSEEEQMVLANIWREVERTELSAADLLLVNSLDHPRLAALARGALAYLGTQRLEPFGMSCAEAMAAGLPVIVSERAGIAAWLKDGEDALLVDPKDPTAIAQEILRLLRDPELRERLARAGRAKALRDFHWEQIAERQGKVLDRLVSGIDPRNDHLERPAEQAHFARRKGRGYHRMTPLWRGDFPHIVQPMVRAAEELLPEVIDRIDVAARHMERLIVAIAGESGSGKSEIAHLLNLMIRAHDLWGVVIPGDAFFVRSPMDNHLNRVEADREGRLLEVVGPQEVDLARLDAILGEALYKEVAQIFVPSYSRTKIAPDRFYAEVPVSLYGVDVLFVDLTYSLLLENATCRIFLEPSALDRLDAVRKRNLARDPDQDFDFIKRVLIVEHEKILPLMQRADLTVDGSYRLRKPPGP